MPKAPEPSSTCQKTTKSLPRISPKSYCYNAVPNRFLAHFSTSRTNGPRLLSRVKAGTHSAFQRRIAHSGSHAETVAFRMRVVSLPSDRSARSRTSPGRVSERRTLPLWDLGREVLLKNTESLWNSDALMRVAVPRRRGPAGLRDPFSSVEIVACMPCAQGLSACARHGRYHYPRRAPRVVETPDGRLSKRLIYHFGRSCGHHEILCNPSILDKCDRGK